MSPEKPTRQGPNARLLLIVGGIVAAIALIAVVVFAMGDDDDTVAADGDGSGEVAEDDGSSEDDRGPAGDGAAPTGPEVGSVEVSGTPLPPLPESGRDPAVGMTAPVLSGSGPFSTDVVDTAGDDEGHMLVFLAHWCPHCQAELPRLVDLQEAGAFDDIRAVALLVRTTPDGPNYPPSRWLDDEGWTGDRIYDDEAGTAVQAFGVSGLPFVVFVDDEGTVTKRLAGEQASSVIEDAVEQIAG